MDIKALILDTIKEKNQVKVADVIKVTRFSRAYINRFLQELRNEGKIVLIGKARQSFYVLADKVDVIRAKGVLLSVNRTLKNINLAEDVILDQIKKESGIFFNLPENINNIVSYAFTEMLNNAIEHSQSKIIKIKMSRSADILSFEVLDYGVGIFNNIMRKRKLKNALEAIQDLLKGKQTTNPERHSGEGIFFTSKAADNLAIEGSDKKLFFNNLVDDFFIHDIRPKAGTRIFFSILLKSKKSLRQIFNRFSGESFEFDRTKVAVKLYKMGEIYLSRSQARRILTGLDKFKIIILDFAKVKTVGQAFADEIFRVWQNYHPDIKIESINTNENIFFMISRALNLGEGLVIGQKKKRLLRY